MDIALAETVCTLEQAFRAIEFRACHIDREPGLAVIEFDDAHIELLTPTSPGSPIARFLKQRGKGVHHIAYRVENLDQAIEEAKQQGLTFLEDTYRTTPFGRRLIYMNPRHSHGVITELCDYPENL